MHGKLITTTNWLLGHKMILKGVECITAINTERKIIRPKL